MNFFLKLKQLNRQRNLKTKKIKYKIKSFFISLGYRKHTYLKHTAYKKVCIFMHTQAIGDAIITSGLVNALKKEGMIVYVVIPNKLTFLFPDIINVDDIILFDNENIKSIKKSINNFSIDLVIDLSDYDNAIIFREKTLRYINPKHAISFNQPPNTIFDTNIIVTKSEHISNRIIKVLSLLGINAYYNPLITIDKNIFRSGYDFANKIKEKGKKIIIFNPFAAHENRCLNSEQVSKMINYLNRFESYITIIFDMGHNIDCKNLGSVILNPFKDAGNSFALVNCADLVISVDTAIVHLASALDIKQYCIYNNRSFNEIYDNNIVWAPNSKKAIVLTTNEYLVSESGDDIKKFDIDILIDKLKNDPDFSFF